MFVLRFPTAHNKGNVFAVRLLLAHSKDNEQSNGVTSGWKKMFVVRYEKNARQTICLSCANIKTHDKLFFYRAFFCRALWKIHMAKIKTHNKRPFPHSDCHFSSFHLLFSFSYFIFPDNHNHRFTKSHNKFTITIKITTQWMTEAFAPASEGCAPRVPKPGRQRGRAPPHR
jgi:hypothetical protein